MLNPFASFSSTGGLCLCMAMHLKPATMLAIAAEYTTSSVQLKPLLSEYIRFLSYLGILPKTMLHVSWIYGCVICFEILLACLFFLFCFYYCFAVLVKMPSSPSLFSLLLHNMKVEKELTSLLPVMAVWPNY